MTDVEAKTPSKRRLPEKKSPASAKKQKVSPKKQDKKINKPNNVQNSDKVKGNKKNIESKNGSPKKLKPFVGTSKIGASEQQGEESKKVIKQNKENSESKKPRRNVFAVFRAKINSEEKADAINSIEEKIKSIEARGELTKSAKRKLKVYYRLKRMAGGGSEDQSQSLKVGNKLEQKNRNEGKKKGSDKVQANVGKKNQVNKTAVKGQKTGELNKKQVPVGNKQVNKKGKQSVQIKNEESSDEDDLEEDESGSDEEVDEEQDVENDDDSGDEVEGDEEDSDEDEGEEEEESDEDDSEEDSPPPQVSNKKQKKK